MDYYIQLKKANCKNCYKCIRHCPVKSIRFADHQAHIVKDQCILCGECFVVCPQNAKQIKNDVDKAKELIASGKPVYVSVAPSFVANFYGVDIAGMEEALKQLGFAGASETALGATIVKREYEKLLRQEDGKVIISSCCHSVNSLIQKYFPEALPYLAKVVSPMQAHCLKIKEEHPDSYTVFVGPCISKKEEADQYAGLVDCVLTFEELSGWLQKEGISLSPSTGKETMEAGRARLFPTAGGIIRSMIIENTNYDYIAIDGTENCIQALKDIISGKLSHCFIEMSACVGSCIGGPAMNKEQRTPVTDYIAVNRYAKEKDFDISSPASEKLSKPFAYLGHTNPMPGSSAIAEILHKMGKSSPEQELNCGSCGYNTCREKAIAVLQGKADLTMCLPFLKEKAENFSDNIIYNMPSGVIVLNEDLEVQQINRAAKQILNIKHKGDILGAPVVRILNPAIYLEVISGGKNIRDRLTYLAEYSKYIEETIIYDRTYHIIISIFRDVTEEEKARIKKEKVSRQSIEITDKVIEKQMRVVQEIASLLGETTAETKIALTHLKETLNNE
ncbi:MAG TPA: histidine kinase [Lachnospiraceae bacterium]|jgi:iron only hydrogenase large subunit-like protein/uncharacterized Fe-S cluster-containing protein|nr:histidine kinase [Lachnospiraceae bacterium]HBY71372.1 histidine kinase [Lachnospiraceae bacterium]HCA69496.1 histidine kinase [Lachnospiraceae bacterium]HCM14225.1 histidine kinase [Lachnospiraceae bacterium]HCR39823.1 histidine kinase [Lachnospiraceae bacterium]